MKKILPKVRAFVYAGLKAVGLNTPTRIVIALSPVALALSGFVVAVAGKYLPFVHLDANEVSTLFDIGAAAMAAKLLLWLRGAQKLEQVTAPVKLIPGVVGERIVAPSYGHNPGDMAGDGHVVVTAEDAQRLADLKQAELHEVGEQDAQPRLHRDAAIAAGLQPSTPAPTTHRI